MKKTYNPCFTLFVQKHCCSSRRSVKQRMGKLSNEITTQGPALFNVLLVNY
jgi:hypothetical protein